MTNGWPEDKKLINSELKLLSKFKEEISEKDDIFLKG